MSSDHGHGGHGHDGGHEAEKPAKKLTIEFMQASAKFNDFLNHVLERDATKADLKVALENVHTLEKDEAEQARAELQELYERFEAKETAEKSVTEFYKKHLGLLEKMGVDIKTIDLGSIGKSLEESGADLSSDTIEKINEAVKANAESKKRIADLEKGVKIIFARQKVKSAEELQELRHLMKDASQSMVWLPGRGDRRKAKDEAVAKLRKDFGIHIDDVEQKLKEVEDHLKIVAELKEKKEAIQQEQGKLWQSHAVSGEIMEAMQIKVVEKLASLLGSNQGAQAVEAQSTLGKIKNLDSQYFAENEGEGHLKMVDEATARQIAEKASEYIDTEVRKILGEPWKKDSTAHGLKERLEKLVSKDPEAVAQLRAVVEAQHSHLSGATPEEANKKRALAHVLAGWKK